MARGSSDLTALLQGLLADRVFRGQFLESGQIERRQCAESNGYRLPELSDIEELANDPNLSSGFKGLLEEVFVKWGTARHCESIEDYRDDIHYLAGVIDGFAGGYATPKTMVNHRLHHIVRRHMEERYEAIALPYEESARKVLVESKTHVTYARENPHSLIRPAERLLHRTIKKNIASFTVGGITAKQLYKQGIASDRQELLATNKSQVSIDITFSKPVERKGELPIDVLQISYYKTSGMEGSGWYATGYWFNPNQPGRNGEKTVYRSKRLEPKAVIGWGEQALKNVLREKIDRDVASIRSRLKRQVNKLVEKIENSAQDYWVGYCQARELFTDARLGKFRTHRKERQEKKSLKSHYIQMIQDSQGKQKEGHWQDVSFSRVSNNGTISINDNVSWSSQKKEASEIAVTGQFSKNARASDDIEFSYTHNNTDNDKHGGGLTQWTVEPTSHGIQWSYTFSPSNSKKKDPDVSRSGFISYQSIERRTAPYRKRHRREETLATFLSGSDDLANTHKRIGRMLAISAVCYQVKRTFALENKILGPNWIKKVILADLGYRNAKNKYNSEKNLSSDEIIESYQESYVGQYILARRKYKDHLMTKKGQSHHKADAKDLREVAFETIFFNRTEDFAFKSGYKTYERSMNDGLSYRQSVESADLVYFSDLLVIDSAYFRATKLSSTQLNNQLAKYGVSVNSGAVSQFHNKGWLLIPTILHQQYKYSKQLLLQERIYNRDPIYSKLVYKEDWWTRRLLAEASLDEFSQYSKYLGFHPIRSTTHAIFRPVKGAYLRTQHALDHCIFGRYTGKFDRFSNKHIDKWTGINVGKDLHRIQKFSDKAMVHMPLRFWKDTKILVHQISRILSGKATWKGIADGLLRDTKGIRKLAKFLSTNAALLPLLILGLATPLPAIRKFDKQRIKKDRRFGHRVSKGLPLALKYMSNKMYISSSLVAIKVEFRFHTILSRNSKLAYSHRKRFLLHHTVINNMVQADLKADKQLLIQQLTQQADTYASNNKMKIIRYQARKSKGNPSQPSNDHEGGGVIDQTLKADETKDIAYGKNQIHSYAKKTGKPTLVSDLEQIMAEWAASARSDLKRQVKVYRDLHKYGSSHPGAIFADVSRAWTSYTELKKIEVLEKESLQKQISADWSSGADKEFKEIFDNSFGYTLSGKAFKSSERASLVKWQSKYKPGEHVFGLILVSELFVRESSRLKPVIAKEKGSLSPVEVQLGKTALKIYVSRVPAGEALAQEIKSLSRAIGLVLRVGSFDVTMTPSAYFKTYKHIYKTTVAPYLKKNYSNSQAAVKWFDAATQWYKYGTSKKVFLTHWQSRITALAETKQSSWKPKDSVALAWQNDMKNIKAGNSMTVGQLVNSLQPPDQHWALTIQLSPSGSSQPSNSSSQTPDSNGSNSNVQDQTSQQKLNQSVKTLKKQTSLIQYAEPDRKFSLPGYFGMTKMFRHKWHKLTGEEKKISEKKRLKMEEDYKNERRKKMVEERRKANELETLKAEKEKEKEEKRINDNVDNESKSLNDQQLDEKRSDLQAEIQSDYSDNLGADLADDVEILTDSPVETDGLIQGLERSAEDGLHEAMHNAEENIVADSEEVVETDVETFEPAINKSFINEVDGAEGSVESGIESVEESIDLTEEVLDITEDAML